MHDEPTHLDLFSGIGGFALAAGWAGFRTIAFSEIDTYASAVLKKHWPDVPNLGDIRSLDGRRFHGECELLTAGVPCQPASCAGQQRGSADDRWLWPEALRILGEAKPAVAVFENPPGILALSGGVEFERLLSAMEGHGYAVQPIIVPAVAVDARHRRDRVWIVANLDGTGRRIQPESWRAAEAEPAYACSPRTSADVTSTRQANALGCQKVGKSTGERAIASGAWSEPNSGLLRVVHGLPDRMDRIGGLGNAIVPQVAYQILKAIREQL